MQDLPIVTIAGRKIGTGFPPFVIAEMSGNHNHSLERALQIVEAAARAGADAIKLQTYTADTMTLDVDSPEFTINDPDSLWAGRRLYDLYDEAHTPWEWHEAIFSRARELGIIPFSSPFDHTAVDFLESLDAPAYKIASFELTDHALVSRAAATGKPLIMSTGMATAAEIDRAVNTARSHGCEELVLLKCTSTYPAEPAASNIATIPHLATLFNCPVGLSDHTLGIGVAVGSVVLGAAVIEKHFTLSRADGGVDAAFSLEPAELGSLVSEAGRAWAAIGAVHYGPGPGEQHSLVFRRSLYVTRDIREGEPFSGENIRSLRPGGGIEPEYLPLFLGRRAARDVRRGERLDWDLIAAAVDGDA